MKRLFIVFVATLMSCASTSSQKTSGMQNTKAELLVSESQGGADKVSFRIIKDENDFHRIIKGSFGLIELGKEPAANDPEFPKNKKVVLYNMGMFRSGSHRITEIKNTFVKNNVLYVEVPGEEQSGGMEIQVISNPWFIFAVPSDYQFNSVELKYSK
ncbi:hypothetical protein [Chryseobacterium sp.]|uniref:hypothetical protein n=1 Tax=Chryseobacterium sp. TaxID=1871047 RepID=UPI0025BB1153|nr:hypothetical protein [Chryseobacterium sp.]MBV8328355.1 hypothetical protein [Chryseobacterium sp.]